MENIEYKYLLPSDGAILKILRLKAYQDSPEIFGKEMYVEALAEQDEYWKNQANDFADPKNYLIYASSNQQPIASATSFQRTPEEAGLGSVWVDKKFRGNGIATELAKKAIEWANGKNYHSITLWNIKTNAQAEKLYLSLGFVFTGKEKSHPHLHGTILLEMKLDLSKA